MNPGRWEAIIGLAMTEGYEVAIFADTQEEPQWVYQNLELLSSKARKLHFAVG